jgi:hypothetical protein
MVRSAGFLKARASRTMATITEPAAILRDAQAKRPALLRMRAEFV